MLRHIAAQREAGVVTGKGPFAVVMAPTRELALQINEVLEVGEPGGLWSVGGTQRRRPGPIKVKWGQWGVRMMQLFAAERWLGTLQHN